MAKRALVIRHSPAEDVCGFGPPIRDAGYAIETIDVTDPSFATLDWQAPDLIALMGGAMGVYQRDKHPWIEGELKALAGRIAERRPTLGVCLGSQMIAAALGANVYKGPVKEVGFAPIGLTEAGETSPLRHIADVPMMHWHGDTFNLPDGAELLAFTRAYPNQAFRIGNWLLALQFHPEMGVDGHVEDWLRGADRYLADGGTDARTVRADYARLGPAAVEAGQKLLGEWLEGLSERLIHSRREPS